MLCQASVVGAGGCCCAHVSSLPGLFSLTASCHARLVNPENSLFQNAAATCKPSTTFDMKTADAQHSDHCTLNAVSTFDFCFQGTAPAALLVLGVLGVVAVNSVISPNFDFACKADLLQTAM